MPIHHALHPRRHHRRRRPGRALSRLRAAGWPASRSWFWNRPPIRSPLKRLPFGMRGLSAPTLEAFDRRDLLNAVEAARFNQSTDAAKAAHWMQQPRRPAGHFAGIPFFHEDIDTARWPIAARSGGRHTWPSTWQASGNRPHRPGDAWASEIRRGSGVEGFEQSDDGVGPGRRRALSKPAGWSDATAAAALVRKAAASPSSAPIPSSRLFGRGRAGRSGRAPRGATYTATGMYTYARPGVIAMVDFDGGAAHRTAAAHAEHVQAVLRRVSGVDVTLTALTLATTWTDRAFQATDYRGAACCSPATRRTSIRRSAARG
jgi:hypothetical protein